MAFDAIANPLPVTLPNDPLPVTNNSTYETELALGNITGRVMWSAMGERESMAAASVNGEDIWRGTATSIPTPPAGGEQMTVVSSSNADNGATATGVITLRIHYLDASGDEQTEDITMNGTTGVNTVATDIRFVNDMYTLTKGSNGVAEGTIDIHQLGSSSTIYNMIHLGGNKSLVPHRMIPAGHVLILKGWQCSEAQGRRIAFRIRSTDMYGTLITGVFCFKDTFYTKQGASGWLPLNIPIPALSILKVSGWPDQSASEGSCGWRGELITL